MMISLMVSFWFLTIFSRKTIHQLKVLGTLLYHVWNQWDQDRFQTGLVPILFSIQILFKKLLNVKSYEATTWDIGIISVAIGFLKSGRMLGDVKKD
jgi:hypothetical protein